MAKWQLKGCPRCGGDMYVDKDIDGWYTKCLQCSFSPKLSPIWSSTDNPLPKKKTAGGVGKN